MPATPLPDPTESDPPLAGDGVGYQPRQLVLLGAGPAHLQTLAHLARHPLVGARIILLAPYSGQLHSNLLPGLVAGHYQHDDCVIPLEPLVRHSGVQWVSRGVRALDAQTRSIQLDDGTALHYDWLSINTGPLQNRALLEQTLPGAREHGLFLRPIEAFAALWPQVAKMADARPLRFTVIGAGASGAEMAMALRKRFASSSVTLLSGQHAPGAEFAECFQHQLLAALKARQITVIRDRAVGFRAGEVLLGCGACLACDVPLICTGPQAAPWLQVSGLALDQQGFVAVDTHQRSISHPEVFAAGDVSSRSDPLLAVNLRASVNASALKEHQPPKRTLALVSCGDQRAMASWGQWSAQGRWVWWLKNWLDRRYVASFRKDPKQY
jgi:NADH dehydrogenase FAD-containing subunit